MKWSFILFILLYTVAAKAQTVDFSYTTTSGTFCNPQMVHFTQNCSGNPGGFTWNFGNGQGSVHGIDSVQYALPGTYTVTLIGLYADTAIRATKTITIHPTPSISLSVDNASICQPGNINFTAGGSSFITDWEWDFGDGSPVQTTGVNSVSHFYADYGSYTVSVKGTTAFGCSDTTNLAVEVKKVKVTLATVDPLSGCIPVNAVFNLTTEIPQGDAAQSYLWDFGDGSPTVTSTTPTTSHPYNTTASVTPHVTITTVQGCVKDYEFSPLAYGIPPLDIHGMTTSGMDTFCGSEHVEFNATSIDATEFEWHFGDGNVLTSQVSDITHQYPDTGHMHVVVIALFNGCPGAKDSFDIYIKGVVAKFKFGNSCSNKNDFSFINQSKGHITHFEWNFADDPTVLDSVHYDVSHIFPVSGEFPVRLTLRDSLTGCEDTRISIIYTATPSFSSSVSTVCKDSLIVYTISNSYPPYPITRIQYDYAISGQYIDSTGTVLQLHPAFHGIFSDYVIINHNDSSYCNDTLRLPAPTRVAGPVTNFTALPQRVCRNVPIVYTNTSVPFFSADPITHWWWDFADGQTDTARNPPPHLYANQGGYIVSLLATDINGCKLEKTDTLSVDPIPEVTVYPRVDTICLGRDTATLSVYTIYPYVWSPSPGLSCNHCDTIRAYPLVTTAYIATATNLAGCTNRDTALVKVYAPFHNVITPGNVAVCPQVPVQLNVNPRGITVWSPATYLSDATIPNPILVPDTSIIYRVIVSDSAGCYADTTLVNIHVNPLPAVDAGPDRKMPYGTAFTLSPIYGSSVVSYLWTPPGDLTCTNCARPDGTATQTQLYKIEVTDNLGCKSTDSLKIILTCDKSQLYMPSAFTPFSGGPNHYFYPLARGYKSIKSFIIYNRWGNKVFERKDFSPNIAALGWDGMIKGDDRNSTQAFVWFVEAVCDQGETVEAKGTVLLIR